MKVAPLFSPNRLMHPGSVCTGLDKYTVMDLIDIFLYVIFCYAAFKFGETSAYLKIGTSLKSMQDLKDIPNVPNTGTLVVERINNQYYAYVDGTFVGQGIDLDHTYKILHDIIVKNPDRFSAIKIQIIE
jgi:hypothetical protein